MTNTMTNSSPAYIAPELQQAAADLLGLGKVWTLKTVDFVSAQAPEVVEEFLKWRVADSLLCVVSCIGVLIIAFFLARKASRFFNGEWGCYILFGFLCIPMGMFISDGVRELLQIWLSPKVYLLENLARLIK